MNNSKNTFHNNRFNYSDRSPLRYPGGKTRAVKYITQFFPEKLDVLLSPFLGGGSIELAVAAKGTIVYGYDTFEPLVEFWQCLLTQPQKLADAVHKYYPLTKVKFYALQQSQSTLKTKMDRAAAYYVLNRASFSGTTLSGGMSSGHPRFTKSSIEKLSKFHNPHLHIKKADFKTSLQKHPHVFAYCDPPYCTKNALYGRNGDAHRDFDHAGLAALLTKRKRWLLSYNDCKEIRKMYKDFSIIKLHWKYGMTKDKRSNEILIFSKDL